MATPERNDRNERLLLWTLRVLWLGLPVALAPPLASALEPWTGPEDAVAEALAWAAWGAGVVAVLAPRPAGLTGVRLLGPLSLGVAVATTPGRDLADALPALVHALLVTGLCLTPEVAGPFVNGGAYGDERRSPLRSPPAVRFALAPLATLLVGAALAAAPLLLASERWGAGVLALLAGVPVVAVLGRSLHALSRRWLVFVPGGVVVHDPLTLAHPILLPRDHLGALGPPPEPWPGDAVDLRLGARGGELAASLTQPLPVPVVGRNRREVDVAQAAAVIVSLARPGAALREAARRRLPI
ncbi:MAG: hypothetical protein HYU28_03250 [Actinobacteria bacterium]|nr:hypothetical protein [Actinomycetota bacterium]